MRIRWWTGTGGLAFSLLIEARQFGLERSRSPLVALAAAITVVETVRPLLSALTIGIHWPNDVFVDGRKLAGVLVEVPSDRLYVVGIGIVFACDAFFFMGQGHMVHRW